jgi:ubiquinone/menaquinone biosynthesis C-methylase UbiE
MSQTDRDENDLDSQHRRPFGEVGRKVGQAMSQNHLPENLWTVKQLNPQPTDYILEVGFGPGVAVQELLKSVTNGLAAGIDFSEIMVSAARERNVDAVQSGQADLRYGEASALPFEDAFFDKAFSIHSIYFWPQPLIGIKELYRVLKPGGLLVITVLPKETWPPNAPGSALEFGTPECTPYFASQIEQMMLTAGFSMTSIAANQELAAMSNFSVLGMK